MENPFRRKKQHIGETLTLTLMHDYRALPRSLRELIQATRDESRIEEDIYLCPGLDFQLSPYVQRILGQFGIVKVYPESLEIIARAGFSIIGDVMEIVHTPQPQVGLIAQDHQVSREAKRFLYSTRNTDFRYEIMDIMIEIARQLRLRKINGTGAANHVRVTTGTISLQKGEEYMDELFESFNFTKRPDGNFGLFI